MALMLGWLIVVALVTLAALETGRYLRARKNPNEFPYPRRRLIRRINISSVFGGIMLLIMYWPKTRPGVQLALMGCLFAGLLMGFVLLWRDLRETSQAVIHHANDLSRETGESFRQILEKKPRKSDGSGGINGSSVPPSGGVQS